MVDIRPLTGADLEAVVELRAAVWPDDISTPESFAWVMAHTPADEHVERWVAADQGELIGFASAGLAAWTTERLGYVFGAVRPDRRGRGIGRRLFEAAETHLTPLAPERVRTGTERGDAASAQFISRRGFVKGRAEQVWSVDPRSVPRSDFDQRVEAARAQGLRLAPLRELLDRPEAIYELTHELERDVPEDAPVGQSYEAWRAHEFDVPLFSPDASFCLLTPEGLPVALAWMNLDLARNRGRNGLTGTLRPYRRRGLAHLVKLASLGWLADHGVTVVYTDNDTTNRDMLALNERLGYQPMTIFDFWSRSAFQ